ncbi:MAG: hypothetical protein COW71_06410 [Ignavibacteriales bacterium CG18_big_fil_WC_8_21_14_2_50_31_20]|nr:MAG: hypothetical protein COW71_06410 [Ignavibacteriales bacterium CG18_big_fil_WC_8_21_14_2_50_31_20]
MTETEQIISIRNEIKLNPNNEKLKGNYFWLIHKMVKSNLETNDIPKSIEGVTEMAQYQIESQMAYNSIGWNAYKTLKFLVSDNALLNRYKNEIPALVNVLMNIKIEKQSILYSSVFWILNKIADAKSIWFLQFSKIIGLDGFQKSDFEEKKTNDKTYRSLVVSVHLKLAKIIGNFNGRDKELWINWLLPKLEKMSELFPNEIWLMHHIGKMLLLLNKESEARERVLKVLIKQQNQFWIWSILGETFLKEDKSKALACFAKGMLLGKDEIMLLGLRNELVSLFVELEEYGKAKAEIENISRTRKENKFKLTNEILSLQNKDWYSTTSDKKIFEYYREMASKADDIYLNNFPEYRGIVSGIYAEKNWVFIYFGLNKTARFINKSKSKIAIGDFVKVKISEDTINGELKYNAHNLENIQEQLNNEFIKSSKGHLRIADKKDFGFLEDTLIPANIIAKLKLKNGDEIEGIAIKELNKKTMKDMWRTIKIKKNANS